MSRPNPFRQVVDAVMAALETNDSKVEFDVGQEKLTEHRPDRCIIFVPTSGTFKPAKGGTKEVDPMKTGTPLASIPLNVQAHIFTECFDCTWLLWQNLLNATKHVLQTNNRNVSFSWPQSAPDSASQNAHTICVVQTFEWELTAWEGILPLPVGDCSVEAFVPTRQQQTMLTFKKTGRLVTDPDEPL